MGLLCCLCRCITLSQKLLQSLSPTGLLKAPGPGAGERGCSSQPSRGRQGGRKGLTVPLPGLPLTGRLPARPSHLALNWGGLSPPGPVGSTQRVLVLAGPPRPARGCQQGLRAPTQACGFPVSPPAPGPTRCRGVHTHEPSEPGRGSAGSRRRLPNIWKHRLLGRAVPEVTACCFAETQVPDPGSGDQQKGAWHRWPLSSLDVWPRERGLATALSWARMPLLGQVHAHGLPSERVQLVYVQRLHPSGMRL